MEHAGTGIPGTEPPSEWSARLWPSWSMPRYRRTYPTFERIDRQMITCKKLTLCWAGAGRTIPASNRRPIGFAGDPHGIYLRYPSRSFDMAVEASFRSHGANQSQASFGTVPEWFRRSAPEQVWELTKALRERTWCRAGSGRVVPASSGWPTGFAGNPHGAYPRFPSRT